MNVRTALEQRQSVRAFLPQNVAREVIERILDAARHAPSGGNTQPWQVAIVSGQKKLKLQLEIETAFRSGEPGAMDYPYYPRDWSPPYQGRRKSCALQLYETLGIGPEDRQARTEQWVANYRAFDAPVVLFFFLDPVMETGSFLDYGMFIQSVMLMAVEEGLATCPQASLGEYPQIVKKSLGYPAESILLCGMALGYADRNAVANSYRTPREPAPSFARFFQD
ncbi:MAG: nitroreductase [Gammaproteobacteria bacterium]|nr:nitroreductase [Gammaproteobacteria bacterium]